MLITLYVHVLHVPLPLHVVATDRYVTSDFVPSVTERGVLANLNSVKQNQKVRPLFQNKAP